ncbi:MAG TPA: VWA domain-containing protein [Candidatus Sulfotelmatobacter sp.]|nr:VWA domain-containing protein [Candidatus Sulfotelmatobacter sp.]
MNGKLVDNIMQFARILRAAGMPVGPGQVIEALRAVIEVGPGNRDDFYWALFATSVTRIDQKPLFDQAFHIYWRNPRLRERLMQMLLPQLQSETDRQPGKPVATRLAEAMANPASREPEPAREEIQLDASLTWSDRELLQDKDFDQMTTAELRQARAMIARLRYAFPETRTRRFQPDQTGRRPDPRATMRATLRSGGDLVPLRFRTERYRPPPLVVLCDISGSMGRYSRLLLHFVHALTNDRRRVSTFLFGTRLTNITRALRHRDVDVAVAQAAAQVTDWSGGTRIGRCLHEFNQLWSRRVLGQGAILLLISDGLDKDAGANLAAEAERLSMSCRRLIWLNPLLRFVGFAPKSLGIRAILPYVDELRPVHNLSSLIDLGKALGRPIQQRGARRTPRTLEAAA